jgi:hypothetical protein
VVQLSKEVERSQDSEATRQVWYRERLQQKEGRIRDSRTSPDSIYRGKLATPLFAKCIRIANKEKL